MLLLEPGTHSVLQGIQLGFLTEEAGGLLAKAPTGATTRCAIYHDANVADAGEGDMLRVFT